jgi:AbrB family looped-hinge helix DNA binding protein
MRRTISSRGQITVPAEIRERLGLVPGTLVEFELKEEGVLLRKAISGDHPVDKVWATLRLDCSVDETLDAMRGPRRRRT